MYNEGDHVFYPKGGIFIVEKECNKTIGGNPVAFYDLVAEDGKTKISIPVSNVDRVGLRHLITSEQLDGYLEVLGPDLDVLELHHKERKARFAVLRETGDFEKMATVVFTVFQLIKNTSATTEEKRIYEQIRERVVHEIQIVRNVSQAQATKDLVSTMEQRLVPPVS